MEVTKSYPVNRMMHSKPAVQIAIEVRGLRKTYLGLEIQARNPEGSESGLYPVDCQLVLDLLENKIGAFGKVDITVKGDYSKAVLETCADKVGEVFGRHTDEVFVPPIPFRQYLENRKTNNST